MLNNTSTIYRYEQRHGLHNRQIIFARITEKNFKNICWIHSTLLLIVLIKSILVFNDRTKIVLKPQSNQWYIIKHKNNTIVAIITKKQIPRICEFAHVRVILGIFAFGLLVIFPTVAFDRFEFVFGPNGPSIQLIGSIMTTHLAVH